MHRCLALILMLPLVGCGADGEPVTPAKATSGVTLSGETSLGVVVK